MEQGSLPERYLSRSVIKHIRRWNPKLSVSAAVGNDYANLHGSVSADGIGDTPWIAWVKAMNNLRAPADRSRVHVLRCSCREM